MNANLDALYQSIQRNTDGIFPDALIALSPEQLEQNLGDEDNRLSMFGSLQRHYPNRFGQMAFEDFSNSLGYSDAAQEQHAAAQAASNAAGAQTKPEAYDVARPEDYEGEGSFYGLSNDDLRSQIEAFNAARNEKREKKRKEIKESKGFLARLGDAMYEAQTGMSSTGRDEMIVNGTMLDPKDEERYNRLVQEQVWRQRQPGSEYEELGRELEEARQTVERARKKDGKSLDTGGAGAYLDKAIKLYRAPSKFGAESGIKNWATGLGDQLADYDTWAIGVTEMARAINLNQLVNKLNDGEELTDSEEAELEAFILYGMVQDARQNDLSAGYKIGKGTAESIPFMAEMLITAGLGSVAKRSILTMLVKNGNNVAAKRLARIFGNEITGMTTEKILGKETEVVALKEVEQKIAERIGRQVGEDVLMTAFMPTTWAQVNEDAVDEKLYGDKNYSFQDFLRTFAGATIETGTEHWGGKVIDNAFGRLMPLDKIWGKTRWGKLLTNDYIQSPLGETGEEYIGAIANYLRSYDPLENYDFKKNEWKHDESELLREEARQMFSVDGFAQTFLTVLPMSSFGGVVNATRHKININTYNKSKKELISLLEDFGATNEQAANIVLQIEGTSDTKQFAEMMSITEHNLLGEYLRVHPDATNEDYQAQKKKIDDMLGKYMRSAYFMNETSGELMRYYQSLPDDIKAKVQQDFANAITSKVEEADTRIAAKLEEFAKQKEEEEKKQKDEAVKKEEAKPEETKPEETQETEKPTEEEKKDEVDEKPVEDNGLAMLKTITQKKAKVMLDGQATDITYSVHRPVWNEDGSLDENKSSNIMVFPADGGWFGNRNAQVVEALQNMLREQFAQRKAAAEAEAQSLVAQNLAPENQNGEEQTQEGQPAEEQADTRTPEQIAADEAAAAEEAEQKRQQDLYASMQQVVSEKGLDAIAKFTPEQKFIWTMNEDGIDAALEDANAYLEQASNEKDPTVRRAKMKQWQAIIDKYGQKVQESEKNLAENLDNSENSSTFAPNSESNDNTGVQQQSTGGNQSSQPEPQQGGLGGDREGAGADDGGRSGNSGLGRNGMQYAVVNSLDGLNEEIDTKLRAKGVRFPDVRVVRVGATDFHKAISEGRAKNPDGWRVDVHPKEEYDGMTCLLTPDGHAGIAVKSDGDIVSLFSDKMYPGVSRKLLLMAVAHGGAKADFYMTPGNKSGLQNLYWRLGARITGQTPFDAGYMERENPDWVAYRDKKIAENGPEEGLRIATNHPLGACIFSSVDEMLDAFVEREGKNVDLTDIPNYENDAEYVDDNSLGYTKMINARDAELAENLNAEEQIKLDGDDIVLMSKSGSAEKVFCKKDGEGNLIRLDNGKALVTERGGKETAWSEKSKEIVYYNGKPHYLLGYNHDVANVVPVETTMPVLVNTARGNGDSVLKVDRKDLQNENGEYINRKNNRDDKLEKLLKEAKTNNDVLDYVVFDRRRDDGSWFKFTLRELLDMVSVVDDNNKRKYVGDEKFKKVFETLMDKFYGEEMVIDNFRKNGTLEDDTIAVLLQAIGEGARAWNQLNKDNKIQPGKSSKGLSLVRLSSYLRNFVKAIAIANGEAKVDTLKKKSAKEKRMATADDLAKREALREQLKEASTKADMDDIKEEIMKLMSEVDFSQTAEVKETETKEPTTEQETESKEEPKSEVDEEPLTPLQLLEKERDHALEMLEMARNHGNKELEEELLTKVNDLGRRIFEANQQDVRARIGDRRSSYNEEQCMRVVELLRKAGINIKIVSEEEILSAFDEGYQRLLRDRNRIPYGVMDTDGKMLLLDGYLEANTPIHEYTHFWVDIFSRKNPEKWKDIVDVLKQTQAWQDVLTDEDYQDIREDEYEVSSEVMSRLTGDYWAEEFVGKTRLDDSLEGKKLGAKVRSALRSFWEEICRLLGIGYSRRISKDFDNKIKEVLTMPLQNIINNANEMREIKERSIEDGTFMKAPDGTDTKLTEDQWLQVRTESFKRWAGDWENGKARIFMDENGEPKVLYHGTRRFGFNSFDIEKSQSAPAIFFADSEDVAKGYAGLMSQIRRLSDEKQKVTTKDVLDILFSEDVPLAQALDVIVRYADCKYEYDENGSTLTITPLATQDPFEIYIPGTSKAEARKMVEENLDMDIPAMHMTAGTKNGGIYATFVRAENVLEIDAKGEMWDEIPTDAIPGYPDTGERVVDTNWIAAWAKDQGYDGIIVRNTWDTAGEDIGLFSNKSFDEYISLLDKGDIKSAVENIGDFDENEKDMRLHIGPMISFGEVAHIDDAVQKKIDKESKPYNVAKYNASVPMPDEINKLGKAVTCMLDRGNGLRILRERMNATREYLGRGKYSRDKYDVRALLEQSDAAIAAKSKLFEDRELKSLMEWIYGNGKKKEGEKIEGMAKAIENSELYKKYKDETFKAEDGKTIQHTLTVDEFIGRYLIARDNMERIERKIPPRGIVEFKQRMGVDMITFAKEFWASYGMDAVTELHRRVKAVTDLSLDTLYKSGNLTKEAYDSYKSRKFYVPEKDSDVLASQEARTRWERFKQSFSRAVGLAIEEFVGDREGQKSSIKPLATSYRARGGNSLAGNIFEHIVQDTYDSIYKAEKNKVKIAQYEMLREDPEVTRILNLPVPKQVYYVKNEEGKWVAKDDGPTAEEKADAKAITTQVRLLEAALVDAQTEEEKNEIYTAIDELIEMMPFADEYTTKHIWQTEKEKNWEKVDVYVDGILQEMRFPNMLEVANALNDRYNTQTSIRAARQIGNVMASMATQFNPTFFAVNVVRDTPFILSKGISEYGWEFVGKFAREIARGESHKAIWNYLNGTLDENAGGVYSDFYNFVTGGGQTGYSRVKELNDIRGTIQKWSAKKNVGFGEFMDIAPKLNEWSELWTRFAAYKAVLDLGYSEEEALKAAKNLSINFNRRGYGAPLFNVLSSLSMFANATIQGASGFYRAFGGELAKAGDTKGKKIARVLTKYMSIPAIIGFLSTITFMDDDDDEKKIPDWERDNYLCLGPVRIPLNEQLKPFYLIGVNAAMLIKGKRTPGEALTSLVTSITTNLIPAPPTVTGTLTEVAEKAGGKREENLSHVIRNLWMPQGLQNWNAIAEGKDWLGNDLRKDFGDIPEFRMSENESALYRDLAYLGYVIAGGRRDVYSTKYKSGRDIFYNRNPKEIKNNFFFGIMPDGWQKLTELIWGVGHGVFSDDKMWGESIDVKNIPFASKFWRPKNPEMFRYGIVKQVKDELQQYKDQKSNYKKQAAGGNAAAQAELDKLEAWAEANGIKDMEKTMKEYNEIALYRQAAANGMNVREFKRANPDADYKHIDEEEKRLTQIMLQHLNETNGVIKTVDIIVRQESKQPAKRSDNPLKSSKGKKYSNPLKK